jgi:hypothetical protein
MIGAAFSTSDTRTMDARFAYRRTWTPEAAAQRAIGDDALAAGPGVDQEFVTGTVALRLARERVFPSAAFRYNLGTGRVDDVSGALSWAITPLHMLRASYVRTIPLFDLDSVFNVFAIEPFEDARVLWEVRPNERWAVSARAQARFFRNRTTGELDQEPDQRLRVGAGGGAAASYRVRRFAARLDAFGLGGEGGARAGASLDSRTHLVWDRLAFDARTYFVWYRDDVDADRRGYSLAVQAGGNLRLAHGIYLDVVGEELVTPYLAPAFRLLGILSFDWAFRAGQR